MLKHFRNPTIRRNIYLFLAVVIIPPFLFWGVFISKDDAPTSLGMIDGKKVPIQRYLSSYRAAAHQAMLFYGDQYDAVRNRLNLRGEAWDRILLLDHAKKEGLKVSDTEVVQWITRQEAFRTGGRFNDAVYRRYVEELFRTKPRQFEEEIRELLTLAKVREKVRAEATNVSEEELKREYERERSEKSLLVGVLTAEAAAKDAKVEDAEVEKVYSQVRDRLTGPDRVNLKYISVPASNAEAVKKDAGSLEELAAKHRLDVKETGLFSADDAPPGLPASEALVTTAFSLAAGAESEWLEAGGAVYKLKAVEKKPGGVLPLEDAREEIRRVLQRQTALQAAAKKLEGLKERLVKEDFETVLKSENAEIKRLPSWRTGQPIEGVAGTERIDRAIGSLADGAVSPALTTDEAALVVKVVSSKPADMSKYEVEKADFRKVVEEERTEKALGSLIERLRSRLVIDLETMKKLFGEPA